MSSRRVAMEPGITGSLRAVLFGASLGCLSAVANADDWPGEWIEVRTPHFVVISNASPSRARETAEHFERIRALFQKALPSLDDDSRPPLKVFAARDEPTMKRLLPASWGAASKARPAGVFQKRPTSTVIAVRADLLGGSDFRVVYHEYFHFLAATTGSAPPVWIGEGLAEFWGNARLTAGQAQVGLFNAAYLDLLRESPLLPLDLLVTIDRSSEHYHEGRKKKLFYAQSWALVHYLLMGEEADETRGQFFEYLRLLSGGMTSPEAATRAFGDLSKLKKKLAGYVRRSEFGFLNIPAPEPPPADRYLGRELPRAEAAAQVARFLLDQQITEGVEGLVALALKGAPDLAHTQETSGLLHLWRGDHPEAEKAFEQAIRTSDESPTAHYALAVLRFHRDRSADGLAAVERSLQRAIDLRADFVPAWSRLAEVHRRMAGSGRALATIRSALAIAPDHFMNRLKAAQILLEGGDRDAARTIAAQVVSEATFSGSADVNNNTCWLVSLSGLAETALAACDRAVELSPQDGDVLDSRGLARALAGDLKGALSDLRAGLRQAGDGWSAEDKARRQAWIRSLESGVSPFAGDGLEKLREDEESSDLGWGR